MATKIEIKKCMKCLCILSRHRRPKLFDLPGSWQLKGGHFSQKRKFSALLAISHHRRDLFIIQCTDKPYLVYPVGPRRKATEIFSIGYHYFFFGAHLAQPVQLGCSADFEQFWPILAPKYNRISFFFISGFPLDIVKISGHSGSVSSVRGNPASICVYYGQ